MWQCLYFSLADEYRNVPILTSTGWTKKKVPTFNPVSIKDTTNGLIPTIRDFQQRGRYDGERTGKTKFFSSERTPYKEIDKSNYKGLTTKGVKVLKVYTTFFFLGHPSGDTVRKPRFRDHPGWREVQSLRIHWKFNNK